MAAKYSSLVVVVERGFPALEVVGRREKRVLREKGVDGNGDGDGKVG